GLARNLRPGTVNCFLVREYLKIVLPLTILGAVIAPAVRPRWLFLAFAAFVFVYSTRLLVGLVRGGGTPLSKDERLHWEVAALGGFLTGLITVGVGELLLPFCLPHKTCQNPGWAVGDHFGLGFLAGVGGYV